MDDSSTVRSYASSDLPLPSRIDGFELVYPLGSGGQGHVWLAKRTVDDSRVAIKILSQYHGNSVHTRARFEQSIATLASLDHPGIVRNIEYGELPGGQLWHATEFVAGKTLLSYVDQLDTQFRHQRGRESRLPVHSIIELFIHICEAVEAAHRVGVIHRDLKPSNIIVDDQGKPHLLDFGHATAPDIAGASNLTLSGEFVGTPAYASPEQVLCRPGTIDVRTDVYAIGVMLYQCLTGTFPYSVDGPLAHTFEQIRYAEPTPPRAQVPWIDRDLQSIVLKALSKQCDDRYQSAGELRTDLQRYLRGEAVTARGVGTMYHVAKFLRRHRAAAAAVAVIATLTLGYAVSMTVLYRRAADAETVALKNAADAQEKFSLARETLDFVVSQIETRLDRVSGTRELRAALLKDAYDKLAELTTSDSDDPQLRAELAEVHKRLGSIALDLDLGHEASRHWETSLQILNGLAEEDPENADYLEALSIGNVLLGDLAKGEYRWEEVRNRYARALAIDEKLVSVYPGNDRYLDNLAWSCERMAGRHWCPDAAARREFHRRRHEIALELVRRDPTNPVRLDNLCTSHQLQARLIGDADPSAFADHVQRAIELGERIVVAEPLNAKYAFTFVSALFLKLEEPLRFGDVMAAGPTLERIIVVAESMYRRDPDGSWGKILRARMENARSIVEELRMQPGRCGDDLRSLIPDYGAHDAY